jgi:hypothetical protein
MPFAVIDSSGKIAGVRMKRDAKRYFAIGTTFVLNPHSAA